MRCCPRLVAASMLVFFTSCAQSSHQSERVEGWSRPMTGAFADESWIWSGARPWWNPFGYYGPGYGWSGGTPSGAGPSASAPASRPSLPANTPPQFQKRY